MLAIAFIVMFTGFAVMCAVDLCIGFIAGKIADSKYERPVNRVTVKKSQSVSDWQEWEQKIMKD